MIEEQGRKQIDDTTNLKSNTFRKRFDDFNNGIEFFEKIKFGEIKLEEVQNLQNMPKSNLNKIWRVRHKLEKQNSLLENIKLLYESQEAVIELFDD